MLVTTKRSDEPLRIATCAAGLSTTGSSLPVASPAAAGRRFRFLHRWPMGKRERTARQVKVLEHLEGWVGMRVIDEHVDGREVWVWVETDVAVNVKSFADFIKQCPGYVSGSLKMIG